MFKFQIGRNLCQSEDVLDAIQLVRWYLSQPQIPQDYGCDGPFFWVTEDNELTVLLREGNRVRAALNLQLPADQFLTKLGSAIFAPQTRGSAWS